MLILSTAFESILRIDEQSSVAVLCGLTESYFEKIYPELSYSKLGNSKLAIYQLVSGLFYMILMKYCFRGIIDDHIIELLGRGVSYFWDSNNDFINIKGLTMNNLDGNNNLKFFIYYIVIVIGHYLDHCRGLFSNMIDEPNIRQFLNLFNFNDEDKKKIIQEVVTMISKTEHKKLYSTAIADTNMSNHCSNSLESGIDFDRKKELSADFDKTYELLEIDNDIKGLLNKVNPELLKIEKYLVTIKKGTTFFYGSIWETEDGFRRDGYQFTEEKKCNIFSPSGTIKQGSGYWFSYDIYYSLVYATNPVSDYNTMWDKQKDNKPRYIQKYRVNQDIPNILLIQPVYNIGDTLHIIENMINNNRIIVKDDYKETILKALKKCYNSNHSTQDWFLATFLCTLTEASDLNGWIYYFDSRQLMLCDPKKYLTHDTEFIIKEFDKQKINNYPNIKIKSDPDITQDPFWNKYKQKIDLHEIEEEMNEILKEKIIIDPDAYILNNA